MFVFVFVFVYLCHTVTTCNITVTQYVIYVFVFVYLCHTVSMCNTVVIFPISLIFRLWMRPGPAKFQKEFARTFKSGVGSASQNKCSSRHM